ncbi:MAG: hypothetical protein C0616_01190 [Desulfuromonas sp.]|nr:MAG: hypothetical protein C0616_01190 [Desulfuromonas sp.]
MLNKALATIIDNRYPIIFSLVASSVYALITLLSQQGVNTLYFAALAVLTLGLGVLFRSNYRTRLDFLKTQPDRMEPAWLLKLTVFCVEWVKAVAGAVLVIWWFGGLFFINDFFGAHSPVTPWFVGAAHSIVLYLVAQLSVRFFDVISLGATQD